MRNQGWTQDGTLIKDDELYLDSGVLKVKDISGKVRPPTEDETEQFYEKPPIDLKAEILKLKEANITLMDKMDKLKVA